MNDSKAIRVIVVGLGVQGYKRRKHAGSDYVGSVDPNNPEADWQSAYDVPLDSYDAALVCVPDEPKAELLKYFFSNGKHVLVEKPLWSKTDELLYDLQNVANENKVVCYTAYNHRFEPHFVRMRELIQSGVLGKIYSCRMFYGNGTARLVRESEWRDQGAGVLTDLGCHLLDTYHFWFNSLIEEMSIVACNNFENKSPDHVIIGSEKTYPRVELEMTLLMWRNHFSCDILAENGTAHIESLCKWGPSIYTHRTRTLPSGRPTESSVTLVQEDPTWKQEYGYFKNLIFKKSHTNLSHDITLQKTLRRLSEEI